MWTLYIKFGLVLVLDLCLCIKLGLEYEILNLGPIKFILICHILNFDELILNLGYFYFCMSLFCNLVCYRLVLTIWK